MTSKSKPQPGQLWRTHMIGGVAVKTREGWTWLDGEPITVPVRALGDGPVGYSVEYVERLRAEQCDGLCVEVERERDEAVARAEAAKVALADARAEVEAEREKTRFPGLDDIARDEPWWVLRAAVQAAGLDGPQAAYEAGIAKQLNATADRLEREHAEAAKRDRLIEKADPIFREAWIAADQRGESGGRVTAGLSALADAGLLAEAVDQ